MRWWVGGGEGGDSGSGAVRYDPNLSEEMASQLGVFVLWDTQRSQVVKPHTGEFGTLIVSTIEKY